MYDLPVMTKKWLLSAATLAARYLPERAKSALYQFRPLSGLIRSQLNLAVPQGLTEVTIAGGELVGMRMLLDLHTEKEYWLGTYETNLQSAVKQLVEPGMVVYDVGANIGFVTLLLAKKVAEDGYVYAFEALPANLERLYTNIELNRLENKVIIVPQAVIDRPGETRFLIGPSGGMGKAAGSAGRENVDYEHEIVVQGTSLDEFVYHLGNPPPQLIKIDIEGGEVLALPGMQRLMLETRPIILLELHGHRAARVAWDLLSKAGFRISRMQPDFPVVGSLDELDWKAYLVALPA